MESFEDKIYCMNMYNNVKPYAESDIYIYIYK